MCLFCLIHGFQILLFSDTFSTCMRWRLKCYTAFLDVEGKPEEIHLTGCGQS